MTATKSITVLCPECGERELSARCDLAWSTEARCWVTTKVGQISCQKCGAKNVDPHEVEVEIRIINGVKVTGWEMWNELNKTICRYQIGSHQVLDQISRGLFNTQHLREIRDIVR